MNAGGFYNPNGMGWSILKDIFTEQRINIILIVIAILALIFG